MAVPLHAASAGPRNVKPGDPVGAFKLNGLDGKPIDTGGWGGSPSVWIFVSAEQASSEDALSDLQAALDELAGSNIRAAALTTDAVKVGYFRELRARKRIRIPVALDLDRAVYGRIGVIVLPTTLLIDAEGKLHHVLSGHSLDYGRELRAHLGFLAKRLTEADLQRALATTRPVRNDARERAVHLCRSAEIMLERGFRNEAAAELRKAIEADPKYAPAYVRLAQLKLQNGAFDEAEALVDELLKADPRNRHAKMVLGAIRFRQNRLDEAEALLNEALILNPDPVRTHYWLGRVQLARGDAAKAAEHFRTAIETLMPELQERPPAGPRP